MYDNGTRHTCPYFAAFYLVQPSSENPHIGFTTPRALGKAVVRNRLRRRVREAVRLELANLNPQWSIVFNPRRKTLECSFDELRAEVLRLFLRCTKASPTPPQQLAQDPQSVASSPDA